MWSDPTSTKHILDCLCTTGQERQKGTTYPTGITCFLVVFFWVFLAPGWGFALIRGSWVPALFHFWRLWAKAWVSATSSPSSLPFHRNPSVVPGRLIFSSPLDRGSWHTIAASSCLLWIILVQTALGCDSEDPLWAPLLKSMTPTRSCFVWKHKRNSSKARINP